MLRIRESQGVIASAAERYDLTLMQPLHSGSAFTVSSTTLAVMDLHCEPKRKFEIRNAASTRVCCLSVCGVLRDSLVLSSHSRKSDARPVRCTCVHVANQHVGTDGREVNAQWCSQCLQKVVFARRVTHITSIDSFPSVIVQLKFGHMTVAGVRIVTFGKTLLVKTSVILLV